MLGEETGRQRFARVPYPIKITRGEIESFKRLNPDEAIVRAEADRIRSEKVELEEFPSEQVVVIDRKLRHLTTMEKVVSTGTTIVNIIGFMAAEKDSRLFEATGIVRKNSSAIAQKAIEWIPPDYSPEDTSEKPEDKKVIIPDVETVKVSEILKSFKIPEGIAVDAESIYEKGPSSETLISLCTQLATKWVTRDMSDVDASNFDFCT